MKLTHTGDDGLTGLVIGIGTEGRILLSQLSQGDTHLLLTCAGLRLDGHADNGLGEFHGLQNDGMLLITEGITRGGVLHTDSRSDVAGVAGIDIGTGVCVHHKDSTQTLALTSGGVVDSLAGVDGTGIHSEVAELTHEGIGHDLERQSGEGSLVGSGALILVAGIGVDTLDRGDIQRRGHIIDDGVQHLLHALVAVGRTANDGNDLVVDGCAADGSLELLDGQLLVAEELLHQLLVGGGNSLDQLGAVLLSQLDHVFGDRLNADILTQLVVVDVSLHVQKVDDTAEGHLLTDGELKGHGICVESVLHHVQNMIEVGARDVHLVDISHTGHAILVSLTPDGLRLGLNTALGAEDGHGTVQDAQGTLHLDGEVHVAGGVDDVDAVIVPVTGGSRRGNGDTSLLLLLHPVHGGATLVGLAKLMGLTGVEQDTLGCSGLTGINVSHDTDIPSMLKRILSCH